MSGRGYIMVVMGVHGADSLDELTALRALVDTDPRSAMVAGRAMLDRHPDTGLVRHGVLRALAVGSRLAGTVDESIAFAREALAIAHAIGDDRAAAEAGLTLAGSLTMASHVDEALALLASAPRLDRATDAQVGFQRAAILIAAGRYAESVTPLTQAFEAFTELGEATLAAGCLANRGFARTELGDLRGALADLTAAHRGFDDLGLSARAAYVVHNLGTVANLSGKAPAALRLFSQSEAVLSRLTASPLEPQVSRCRTLLSVGLIEEAATLAARIHAEVQRLGLGLEAAEASLMLGQTQLLLGDATAAAASAQAAAARFHEQGREGWADRAGVLALSAARATGRPVAAADVAPIVGRLEAAGALTAAAEARLLAAMCALDDAEPEVARTWLDGLTVASLPIELQLSQRYARARLHVISGRRRAAFATITSGLRLLDRQRAILAASELRVAAGRHARDLAQLGLGEAAKTGDAQTLLTWLERAMAVGAMPLPVRPPADGRLAESLDRLRRADTDLRQSTADDLAARHRYAAVRDAVAARSREREGGGSPATGAGVAELIEAVGGRVLVELAVTSGSIVGVVVHGGRVRRLPPVPAAAVLRNGRRIVGMLQRVLQGRHPEQAWREAITAAADLDNLVPVRRIAAAEVVIVTSPALQALPWAMLPSLTGRQLSQSASAGQWLRAGAGETSTGGVVVVAGPGLEHARTEAAAVHARWPGSTLLAGGQATVGAVMSAMAGARLAHLVCHGRFSIENAMFSALRLADGDLIVHEIENLDRTPDVVVLSSCEAGALSQRAGAELLGMSAALLEAGTRCMVGPVIAVPDTDVTVAAMAALHQRLAAGSSVAEALAGCRIDVGTDPVAAATMASHVCVGRGDVSGVRPAASSTT